MAFLTDGYQTFINFSLYPGLQIKEIEVQAPGIDSNGMIDTTTMRNTRWRTRQPKHLVTATEINCTVQYDPIIIQAAVQNLIGKNGIVTVQFPDGSKVQAWGFLDHITPGKHKEGEFATAEMRVFLSNQDNAGNEVAPLYIAP